MTFADLDATAVARALCLLSENPDHLVELFLERREEVELRPSALGGGLELRREEGLAVRLVRGRQTWLAAEDSIDTRSFHSAFRRVARRLSQGVLRVPRIAARPWEAAKPDTALAAFPAEVDRCLRARHVAFPFELSVRSHRRWIRAIGRDLAPAVERERFFSCDVRFPAGRWGTLLPELDAAAAERVAVALASAFRARSAPSPEPGRHAVLLAPAAAAIFLHEGVAHALEVDTLTLTEEPESIVGRRLGADCLDLLDDPSSGPEGLRRASDDEGAPVLRRWLLRAGVVQQPIADRRWAGDSPVLHPGAARRQSRHWSPVPRSLHLELLPGKRSEGALAAAAGTGLIVPEASWGSLDPRTGVFRLGVPHARRLRAGAAAERVGPFVIQLRLADLLESVSEVGDEPLLAGAGWCAKGGQKLPVWSTTPALLVAAVEVQA